MKSLVFVIPSLGPGGAERSVVNMANYYIDKFNVTIVALYRQENLLYDIDNRISVKYIADKYNPSSNIISAILSNIFQVFILIKVCKKVKANTIISFTTSANIVSIIASKFLYINVIIAERANPNVYIPNFFWSLLRNITYRFANHLVVQTEYSKEFYSKYIKSKYIQVIPNLINPSFSSKRESYMGRDKFILTVGRLDDNKSQDIIIKAFANCKLDDWKLIVVGDGVNLFKYKQLSKELSLTESIEFVGNVTDVEKYYNISSIFVFASKSEGYPNALLEALYFGLPSISSNCNSGPSDLIQNEENGFLFEVNNVSELSHKLLELVNNENLRFKFSKNAITSTMRNESNSIMSNWDSLI